VGRGGVGSVGVYVARAGGGGSVRVGARRVALVRGVAQGGGSRGGVLGGGLGGVGGWSGVDFRGFCGWGRGRGAWRSWGRGGGSHGGGVGRGGAVLVYLRAWGGRVGRAGFSGALQGWVARGGAWDIRGCGAARRVWRCFGGCWGFFRGGMGGGRGRRGWRGHPGGGCLVAGRAVVGTAGGVGNCGVSVV